MDTIREDDDRHSADTLSLQADLFGSNTHPAQIVELRLVGDRLLIRGQQFVQQIPARQVRWPQVGDNPAPLIELPDGTLLHCRPDPLLARWSAAARPATLPPRRLLPRIGLALVAAGLVWAGLPVAAESVLPQVPRQIDRHVGQRLLDRLDAQWLQPSTLPLRDQQHWRQRLTDAVSQACPAARLPDWNLQFRHSRDGGLDMGALGLPDGTVVVLDQQLGRGTLDALCRELTQLQQRQGMRTLARHQPVSMLMGVAFDDFSSTVAVAWPLLAQHLSLGHGLIPAADGSRLARR